MGLTGSADCGVLEEDEKSEQLEEKGGFDFDTRPSGPCDRKKIIWKNHA